MRQIQRTSGTIKRLFSGESPYLLAILKAQLAFLVGTGGFRPADLLVGEVGSRRGRGCVDVVHIEPREADMSPVRAAGQELCWSFLPTVRGIGKEV